MTDKKPVVLVPGLDPNTDPVLRKARQGIAERAQQMRALRPKIGNLPQANEMYKPGKDAPMSIAQITAAQKAAEGGEQSGPLSARSIEGMKAVAQATQEAQAKRQAAVTPQKETKMSEEIPAAAPPKPTEDKKAHVSRAVDEMDDMEFERVMRAIQTDVIQNEAERSHVDNPANNRITEIDFAKGLADGVFTQIVDVVPGRLKVHYRTVSPMESQAMRLWIFKQVAENAMLDRISGEMFGLANIVASVTQIGGKAYPMHLKGVAAVYGGDFDEEAFAIKYNQFLRMPQPLIHSIGTHSQWFDLRVRKLFTTDHAKNG